MTPRQQRPGGSPAPGWYPDPAGGSGLRYWDGRTWTSALRDAPAGRARRSDPSRDGPPGGRRVAVVAVVAAVLAAVVIGVVIVRQQRHDATDITNESTTYPSRSSWDDGSTPSASPTAPSTMPRQTIGSDPPSQRPRDCDTAHADRLPAPPSDGRVHGGPLSFPSQATPGWQGPVPERRIPYASDVSMMYRIDTEETRKGWQSSAEVGLTAFADYPGAHDAAATMLQCVLTSDLYTSITTSLDSSSFTSVTVDGVQGVRVDAVIGFDHPDLTTKGSRLWIIVVDSHPTTFFFAAVPKEHSKEITMINKVITTLTLD